MPWLNCLSAGWVFLLQTRTGSRICQVQSTNITFSDLGDLSLASFWQSSVEYIIGRSWKEGCDVKITFWMRGWSSHMRTPIQLLLLGLWQHCLTKKNVNNVNGNYEYSYIFWRRKKICGFSVHFQNSSFFLNLKFVLRRLECPRVKVDFVIQ